MISTTNISLQYGGSKLFDNVNIKFNAGNCYGLIGANGAGKSTFLRILSKEIDPSSGEVHIAPRARMSVLKQDHYAYDENTVLDTVTMGNPRLYQISQEKDSLYAKEDFTDEDGVRASELEAEFAELGGWEAESEAAQMLQGLGLGTDTHYKLLGELSGGEKVKVLLAQALFGRPEILLLDEPTNDLDLPSVNWLESFLFNFQGTVIVVSHDRHFLNTVCTHIADIDFSKMRLYVGNYDFWYESSQLMQQMLKDQNKKSEERVKELQSFITRFSANASKSKQATSRKKLLEKITIEEMPSSSRRYPFVGFKADREVGNEILHLEGVSKTIDGVKVLDDITFRVNKDDKIALIGKNEIAITTLLQIIVGEIEPDAGTVKWGVTASHSYLPKDNNEFFEGCDLTLVDWIRQYSEEKSESYVRGFLGRMLFAGEDALKSAKVLSGGEKVRCMLSRMMLSGSNVLLLDQPTNHLDLESITAVNNGLIDFKGNVIFTSFDHQLVQTISNRIIEIMPQGLVDEAIPYDQYLEKRDAK